MALAPGHGDPKLAATPLPSCSDQVIPEPARKCPVLVLREQPTTIFGRCDRRDVVDDSYFVGENAHSTTEQLSDLRKVLEVAEEPHHVNWHDAEIHVSSRSEEDPSLRHAPDGCGFDEVGDDRPDFAEPLVMAEEYFWIINGQHHIDVGEGVGGMVISGL